MLNTILETCAGTLTQGLIYAILSYGIFITYKILDFPDLTVDGSFPLGAAVTAVLLTRGVNAWLTLPVSLFIGAAASRQAIYPTEAVSDHLYQRQTHLNRCQNRKYIRQIPWCRRG